MITNLPSTKVLGVNITTASKVEILEYIFKRLQQKDKKFYIVTPNPEILMYASRSTEFLGVLNHAEVSLPDGVGVLMAGKILKKQIIGRITGVDMMESLCHEASKHAVTVGFLGGRGGVAEMTAKCLRVKYPGLIVSFASEHWMGPVVAPPPSDSPRSHSLTVGVRRGAPSTSHPSSGYKLQTTNYELPTKHIDILFVAFGFPKQEEWIAKNLPSIDVTVAMGVGGAFDYISGKVPRAPKIVRKIGMEWAYRLARQPWRVKRQLALLLFVAEVLKERFFPKK